MLSNCHLIQTLLFHSVPAQWYPYVYVCVYVCVCVCVASYIQYNNISNTLWNYGFIVIIILIYHTKNQV